VRKSYLLFELPGKAKFKELKSKIQKNESEHGSEGELMLPLGRIYSGARCSPFLGHRD
jgi:hypothetical protein